MLAEQVETVGHGLSGGIIGAAIRDSGTGVPFPGCGVHSHIFSPILWKYAVGPSVASEFIGGPSTQNVPPDIEPGQNCQILWLVLPQLATWNAGCRIMKQS